MDSNFYKLLRLFSLIDEDFTGFGKCVMCMLEEYEIINQMNCYNISMK